MGSSEGKRERDVGRERLVYCTDEGRWCAFLSNKREKENESEREREPNGVFGFFFEGRNGRERERENGSRRGQREETSIFKFNI